MSGFRKRSSKANIAGLMGAFGAALIAKERYKGEQSTLLSSKISVNLSTIPGLQRCKLCNNNCLLTINEFSDGSKFVSGNRCERGAGIESLTQDVPTSMTINTRGYSAISRLPV